MIEHSKLIEYDVILFPTYNRAVAYGKQVARESESGLFGKEVGTFVTWISGLWELYGDDRTIVGDAMRHVFMAKIFGKGVTPGTVRVAARLAQRASGLIAFERACEAAGAGREVEALSAEETAFLANIAAYKLLLDEANVVEMGDVLAYLAVKHEEVFPRPLKVVMADASPLTPQQEQFFKACANLEVEVSEMLGSEGLSPAPEEVDVKFAFPAGRYAEPRLMANVVRAYASEGPILITAKDPASLYEALAPALKAEGISVALQARKPLAQTDFGKAYLALLRTLASDPWDRAALTDFMLSPFSGIRKKTAYRFDQAIRGNRTADREAWLQKLRTECEFYSYVEEMIVGSDGYEFLPMLEQYVYAMPDRDDAYKREQTIAIKGLGEIMFAVEQARFDDADLRRMVVAELFEMASLDVSRASGENPQIVIATQNGGISLGATSWFATVVMAQMTSENYSAAQRESSIDTLLEKLGIERNDTNLARLRRQFHALSRMPLKHLVIERCLNDADAAATYPAAVVEEFVDCYREDPSETKDIDNIYSLPEHLQAGMFTLGEDEICKNASAALDGVEQLIAIEEPAHVFGEISPEMKDALVIRRKLDNGEPRRRSLSPSAVERYLEDPAVWFEERRMNLDSLDEDMGPMERGSFAHGVLQAFYEEFRAQGYTKVAESNIEVARELMASIFDRKLAEQPVEPLEYKGDTRFVPLSALEEQEVAQLKRLLIAYLDFEKDFLPGFEPAYLEFEIEPEMGIEYGGVGITGRIDRIDVDAQGNAVIVDYKGGVGAEYSYNDLAKWPKKVQALMYAQALQRMSDAGMLERPLNVVGAVYVSYGKRHGVGGTYDGLVLDPQELPGISSKSARCGGDKADFKTLLDVTEQRIQPILESWVAGELPAKADLDALKEQLLSQPSADGEEVN